MTLKNQSAMPPRVEMSAAELLRITAEDDTDTGNTNKAKAGRRRLATKPMAPLELCCVHALPSFSCQLVAPALAAIVPARDAVGAKPTAAKEVGAPATP